MLNKRGQGLSITAIILIVLGVLVLIFVVLGFTMGWNKIFPFISPGNNVNEIKDQCNFACSTDSTFDYCSVKRAVKVGQDNAIAGLGAKFDATCFDLANVVETLGVAKCPAVNCDAYSSKQIADFECKEKNPDYEAVVPDDQNNPPEDSFRFVNDSGSKVYYSCMGSGASN